MKKCSSLNSPRYLNLFVNVVELVEYRWNNVYITPEFMNIRFGHPKDVFFKVISFCLPNFLSAFQTFVGAS